MDSTWIVHGYFSRLDGVESRLQETSAEFEASRVLAKKTRSEFEIVKKQRCVYHICICDSIS